jgi:hypothetical protein
MLIIKDTRPGVESKASAKFIGRTAKLPCAQWEKLRIIQGST